MNKKRSGLGVRFFINSSPLFAIAAATAAVTTTTAATTARTAATTATTAAARTTAAKTTTTAAGAARCALCSSVDANRAPIQLLSVHGADGLLGRFNIIKRYETETARTSSFTISYYVGFRNDTKRFECTAKAMIICGPGETANKELIAHLLLLP
jgi:hypothetical protein